MKELKGIFYKKDEVIEIYYNDVMIKNHITNGQDDWFGFDINGKEYDLNLYSDTLGLYECIQTGENQYKTGEFVNNIQIEIR